MLAVLRIALILLLLASSAQASPQTWVEPSRADFTSALKFAEAHPPITSLIIATPDKDRAQCVVGDRVVQYDRRAQQFRDAAAVEEKYGVPPESIPDWLGLVGDSADGFPGLPGWGELLQPLLDEIELPEDRSWLVYHLRPEARWHDGQPLTAEDVAYSFDLIMAEGSPVYQQYFADVKKAEPLDEHTVKFYLDDKPNPELHLIID